MRLTDLIIAVAVLAFPLVCVAQDINTEITIEREVVPEQRAATRPDVLPRLQLLQVASVTLPLSDRSDATTIPPYLSQLEPAHFGSPVVPEQGRGYISGGYLPVYNLDLSAGYRFSPFESVSADIFGQFNGHKYDSYFRNSFIVGTKFETNYKAQKLRTLIDFGQSRFNHYDYVSNFERLSHFTMFDFSMDLTGPINPATEYAFGAGVNYAGYNTWRRNGTDPKNSHSNLMVGFNAGIKWNYSQASSWDADLRFNLIMPRVNNVGTQSVYNDNIVCFKKLSFRLTPGFHHADGAFDFRLGLAVDGMFIVKNSELCDICNALFSVSEPNDRKVMVSPDIRFAWMPSGSFTMWANWSGRGYDNFLGDVYNSMPDADMRCVDGFSHIPVDLKAGVNFGPWKGASMQVRANYANAEDWIMPNYYNRRLCQVDLESFMLGAEFRYNYRSLLSLSVAYDRVINSEDYYLWRDGAKAQFRAAATIHPVKPLGVSLSWTNRTGRHPQYVNVLDLGLPNGSQIVGGYNYGYGSVNGNIVNGANVKSWLPDDDYGTVSSLDLSANYTVNRRLNLFVSLENILGKRWFLIGDIPAQRFHGLVGATYTF